MIRVWNASGARGFFGDDYKHLKLLNYYGSRFVAKTFTLLPRKGNMLLDDNYRPREFKPKCIIIKPIKGVVLNNVGLSNPGLEALLNTGKWQQIKNPIISYTPFTLEEIPIVVQMLRRELRNQNYWLQVNFSCPNVHDEGINQREALLLLKELSVPLYPKFNLLTPLHNVLRLETLIDGVVIGNTIPYGMLPDKIDWFGLFGEESPLGGGGLSGKPLFPILLDYISRLRDAGFGKDVIAGGGILSVRNADDILNAGADVIELGTISLLRPWRIQPIIRHCNDY